ncbi:MAG TPA: glutamate--tRNA ligase [Halobacteria archaeon]|nr:glutamate--tRNA ligase [Halobacteria archaeon]
MEKRSESINRLIELFALENAIKHKSAPNFNSVIGKLISEYPDVKNNMKNLAKTIQDVISEISILNDAEIRERYTMLANSLGYSVSNNEKKKRDLILPDLPLKNKDQPLVMRIAPNPNGPATIGHARGIITNGEYARMYGGKFILRFDDTDPRTKRPLIDAYDWYLEDCRWLGYNPDEIVVASDRIPIYYEYAKKLIEMGKSYVCLCEKDDFKRLKDNGKPCMHRDQSVEENLGHWERMLSGEYNEGEAVLRLKTDINDKNPALRDFVIFRIIYEDHPRVGDKYCVWPMLDFESGIEDHLLNVTHIIRGKDLMDAERKQRFFYNYFGWEYPITIYWGRIKIYEFGKISTSSIKKGIEEGRYIGWDDPRLPTVRALKKRGIDPIAIKNFVIGLGVNRSDISISMENLYAENRKIIDNRAKRYFFVNDPIKLQVKGIDSSIEKNVHLPIHPSYPERGYRELKAKDVVFITGKDYNKYMNSIVRLKGLFNIKIDKNEAFYVGDEIKEDMPIIHWLPSGLKMSVLSPEAKYDGLGEEGLKDSIGEVVQLERFGYAKIDSVSNDGEIIAYFSHK